MKRIYFIIAMLAIAVPCLALPLDLNNDTLFYSSGGMTATYNWDNSGTYLSWNIQPVGEDMWHYEYVWHTDGADLSHIIIEVSEGAEEEDFTNWEYEYAEVAEGEPTDPEWFSPSDSGNSNPGLPGSIYGFKLNTDPSVPMFGFSFDTWRSPVWGDFYAKDGKQGHGPDGTFTYAYNAGFTAEDANDGLHIARPDGCQVRVPDGGLTVLLLGISLLGVEALRRRLYARS
jgi:hypothetical protein